MELRSPDGEAALGLDQRHELHAVVVHVGRQGFPEGIWESPKNHYLSAEKDSIFGTDSI